MSIGWELLGSLEVFVFWCNLAVYSFSTRVFVDSCSELCLGQQTKETVSWPEAYAEFPDCSWPVIGFCIPEAMLSGVG